VTKAAEGHDDYRKHTYVLRSFLKCALCGLRMHGKMRRGRNTVYYTCEINRRHAALVPEDHPRMIAMVRNLLMNGSSLWVRPIVKSQRDLPWSVRALPNNRCGERKARDVDGSPCQIGNGAIRSSSADAHRTVVYSEKLKLILYLGARPARS
jgi:hypothetical protein